MDPEIPKSPYELLLEQIPENGMIFKNTLPDSIKSLTLLKKNGNIDPDRITLTKKGNKIYLSVFHDNTQQGTVYTFDGKIVGQYHSLNPKNISYLNSHQEVTSIIESLIGSRTKKSKELSIADANTSFDIFKQFNRIDTAINKISLALELSTTSEEKMNWTAKLLYVIGAAKNGQLITTENIKNRLLRYAQKNAVVQERLGNQLQDNTWLKNLTKSIEELIK